MSAKRGGGSLDLALARAFIASIPTGRWAAYGDVAAAAGAPKGAQALGRWLATNETDVPPLLYRVIRSNGQVSPGYVSVAWPGLPDGPAGVEEKLRSEGVRFDARGRADQAQRWRHAHSRTRRGGHSRGRHAAKIDRMTAAALRD
jgi:alkylated DNA nucleotide flippase Atl1